VSSDAEKTLRVVSTWTASQVILDDAQYEVPITHAELVEVDGIRVDGNHATVKWTWHYKAINDIGEALGDKQKYGSAFTLTPVG
jgi:hypothetical protein